MSDGCGLSDACLLYTSYRRYGKIIDRSDWFTDFRQALAESAPNYPAAPTGVFPSGGNSPRAKKHPTSGTQNNRLTGCHDVSCRAAGWWGGGDGARDRYGGGRAYPHLLVAFVI